MDQRRHLADDPARQPAGSDPTLLETALAAQQLGLRDALNLDGGSSTTLVVAGRTVMNGQRLPIDSQRIGLVPSPSCHCGEPTLADADGRQPATHRQAAAELGRQAAVAGTPGQMHLDLTPGECAEHVIRMRPGHLAGMAVARADGVTLHAPSQQLKLLQGLAWTTAAISVVAGS